MTQAAFLGIIPARYGSTRFPGKPLVRLGGKTLIQRVYERAVAAARLDRVMVATDDQRIADEVRSFGGEVEMTDPGHLSGSDRCAEVAGRYPEFRWVVNIQGDQPFISRDNIHTLCQLLEDGAPVATLVQPLVQKAEWERSQVVKVVVDRHGKALYFSRSAIPFLRACTFEQAVAQELLYKHLGVYGFSREVLLDLQQLPPHPLEQAELLEQLRWLAGGYAIHTGRGAGSPVEIDTPEDLVRAEELLKREGP